VERDDVTADPGPRWWRRRTVLALLALAPVGGVLMAAAPASAATDVVTNCSGSAAVAGSLPYEVELAGPGDTVSFALAPPCSSIDLTSPLVVGTDLTIVGPGAGALTVNGPGGSPVITVGAVTAAISGLTVEDGGGSQGGGISNTGTLTVSGSTITGNTADSGAGIYNAPAGVLTVRDTTISGNTSTNIGGGIENSGTASVADSTISGNSAAFSGGGIDSPVATLTVTNSTVADNVASVFGGGIYVFDSLVPHQALDATIANSTIAGNSAPDGGGIASDQGPIEIDATIVASNPTGGDCFWELVTPGDGGYNIDDDGSCALTGTGDLSGVAAGLSPSGIRSNGGPTQTIALASGSPAIDHVSDPRLCPATDQRGVDRAVPCDTGAYDTDVVTTTSCPVGTVDCSASVVDTSQSIIVTGAKPATTTATITVSVSTLVLSCPNFSYAAPVATLVDSGLTTGSTVDVSDKVSGLPNRKGVLICYQPGGTSPPTPFFLKKCHVKKLKAPCYRSVVESGGSVVVSLVLPAGDPRYHVGGALPAISSVSPVSVAAGKDFTVHGANLSEVTAVTIGGVKARIVKTTPTKVVAVAPAHAHGPVVVSSLAGSARSLAGVTVTQRPIR